MKKLIIIVSLLTMSSAVFAAPSPAPTSKAIARCIGFQGGGNWFTLVPSADGSNTVYLSDDGSGTPKNVEFTQSASSTSSYLLFESKSTYQFGGQTYPSRMITIPVPASPANGSWTMTHGSQMTGDTGEDLVCVMHPYN